MNYSFKSIVPLIITGLVSFAGGVAIKSNKTVNAPNSISQTSNNINNAMMEESEIKRLSGIYAKYSNTIKDPNLTKYVTMNPLIFDFISEYIKNSGANVTGIRFVMIRYDEKYADPKIIKPGQTAIKGKTFPEQNSFAIIPVIDGKEDYNAWSPTNLSKKGMLKTYKTLFSGFNHGDICPSDCYGETK